MPSGLTTTEGITAYLRSSQISIPPYDLHLTRVTRLVGGGANFVYLVTPSTGPSLPPLVAKHAPPYIATAPQIPFSVDRQSFEAKALVCLPAILNPQTSHKQHNTTTPEVLYHDPLNNLLILSYAGPSNLKAAYSLTTTDVPAILARLGTWLATLHFTTRDPAAASNKIGNNKTAKAIYRTSYSRVATTLSEYGFDAQLGEDVNARYGSLLETDDEVQCHGDFWPANVVIQESSFSDTEDHEAQVTVVDWEMTRRGHPGTDVGQFCAESWLLDRYMGHKGLVRGFLVAYLRAARAGKDSAVSGNNQGSIDRSLATRAAEVAEILDLAAVLESTNGDFLERTGVHLGVHLAFWPTRVLRAESKDRIAELVGIGREIIMAAMVGDHAKWLDLLFRTCEGP